MGSAIAAHLAGAGIETHLLDILPPDLDPSGPPNPKLRNRLAQTGLERALAHKPPLFFVPERAALIRIGNLEDDLEVLKDCDLVIEAVVENLDIKRQLFARIAPHLKPTAIIASNTSGLRIADMAAALPEKLRSRFIVMHFFNPVRYMRLLEIAPGPETQPEILQRAAEFGQFLGKGIVYAKDTTNFVANRIGVYSLMLSMHLMLERKLGIEQVDKIVGKPMGRPKSAAFGTADLVGIDTLGHVAKNCYDSLPNDPERNRFVMPEFVQKLVQEGRLGRKSGAGFYKKQGREILVLDYGTGQYRAQEKVRFDSLGAALKQEAPEQRVKTLVNGSDAASDFAWQVLSRTIAYSAERVGEIADDIVNIDRAMRWGFNWELGPFETWDALGFRETAERMKRDGVSLPAWVDQALQSGRNSLYEGPANARRFYDVQHQRLADLPVDPKQIQLKAVKATPENVIEKNSAASLIDLGDGVLGLEVHTKMNTLDGDVIRMLSRAIDRAETDFEALLIANDGEHFGAGANLMLVLMAAQAKEWKQIEDIVSGLQKALQKVRYAKVPVVAAPFQYTLGGGAEVAMAADACQAHAETYMGLVEVGVGLVPAGGGCLRMVERYTLDPASVRGVDLLPFIGEASLNIAMAKVATSAEEAKKLRYLRPTDGISLNRDHLLYEAKQRALGLARSGYRPPLPPRLTAAGLDAAKSIKERIWGMMESGWASEHDALIANKVAFILCGGNVAAGTSLGEQHYLDLEREAFLSLCGEPKSLERMQHMLMHNKPLRN